MIRLADGDRTTFDFVYESTWPLVHSFSLKMIRQSNEAEDIAQQALLKVFSRASEFDRTRDALSWILGITAYECKTAIQKTRRRKEHFKDQSDLDQTASVSLNPEEVVLHNDIRSTLLKVLSEMKAHEQETIISSIEESMQSEVSGATYRKRLQRAMVSLRNKWSSNYE